MVQDIGGGKMNKKQADIEAHKIFQERNRKAEEIVKQAKKEGKWKMGLDSNKDLFADLDKETKKRLELLASMIDEDQEALCRIGKVLFQLKGVRVMSSFKREERIKQLKSCGQSIIDNAEKIVSDVSYPLNTKIIIDMKANEMPISIGGEPT